MGRPKGISLAVLRERRIALDQRLAQDEAPSCDIVGRLLVTLHDECGLEFNLAGSIGLKRMKQVRLFIARRQRDIAVRQLATDPSHEFYLAMLKGAEACLDDPLHCLATYDYPLRDASLTLKDKMG